MFRKSHLTSTMHFSEVLTLTLWVIVDNIIFFSIITAINKHTVFSDFFIPRNLITIMRNTRNFNS
jgi:hypothetical protein